MCLVDWELISKYSTIITSLLALVISFIALSRNTKFSNKNITLSIQQAIFKMVMEKAKDCNLAWVNEPINEKENKLSPHFSIATELIIAIEVIDKAFYLFGKNQASLNEFKKDYYSLYWKQLAPDVRGWVMETTPKIQNDYNDVFVNQIDKIQTTFKDFF